MDGELIKSALMGFLTGLLEDIRKIPHTAISTVLLWVLAWASYLYIYPKVVEAQQVTAQVVPQVNALNENLKKLNARLIKAEIEKEIERDEVYSIERETASMTGRRMDVPETMKERLRKLQRDIASKRGELERFLADNHAALERSL
jgi:hypothetical protein